jgi:hypothetical protein
VKWWGGGGLIKNRYLIGKIDVMGWGGVCKQRGCGHTDKKNCCNNRKVRL